MIKRLAGFFSKKLALSDPFVKQRVLGREFIVRRFSFRPRPDYDDAWFLACSLRAKIIFDIGAQAGDTAFLALFSKELERLVLADSDQVILSRAAENLIMNRLSAKVTFIPASISDDDDPRHQKVTIDTICGTYCLSPDLVKIDIEGHEYRALLGSKNLASLKKTRFLVEMHSSKEMKMADNVQNVMAWCSTVGYRAWYLKEGKVLNSVSQVRHRGRCHLLLQPAEWDYPLWLKGIKQAGALESAYRR